MSDTPNSKNGTTKPTYKLRRTERFVNAYNQAKGGNFGAAKAILSQEGKVVKPYGYDFTSARLFRRNRGVIRRFLNADIAQYQRIGGKVKQVV